MNNDLAVLQGPSGSFLNFRGIGRGPRVGDRVVVLGYPFRHLLGSGLQAGSGEVSALSGVGNDSRFLQVSAPVNPGNSGGPLLDQSGNVVGVVTSKLSATRMLASAGVIPESINFAIKGLVVQGFLDQAGVNAQQQASVSTMSTADIVDAARAAVVVVECWK